MNGYLKCAIATATAGATSFALAVPPPPAPDVTSFSVLFGNSSYNLLGSPRTTDLPWDIAGIRSGFSAAIASGDVNSLSGVSATGFSGLGTNTLTWTFPVLADGPYSAVLAATGAHALKDALGTSLNNGVDFTQPFSVLYADFNGDGIVNSQDIDGVDAARALAYNIFADINGNGVVDQVDVDLVTAAIPISVPEPATLALFGIGLAGLGFARRKQ